MSDDERRRRLAHRHLLLPEHRTGTVPEVAEALVCLHSSDPVSVYLSAALRTTQPSLAAVGAALYDHRSLVRHHAMRRTIWVMTPDVAAAAHAGFTRKIASAEFRASAKRFGRGETWWADAVDRVVAVVESAEEPISTRAVGARVPDLAEPIEINTRTSYAGTLAPHTRALLQAGFEARVVRDRPAGTWLGSQYAWLSAGRRPEIAWDSHDEQAGATLIVERWLERFGPGTLDDLAWWTGGTKTSIRRALDSIGADEVELDDGDVGFVLAGDVAAEETPEWVALLPGLDPTTMGWKRRSWYLPPDIEARVTDRNGNVGPTVWVDGRIAGGWAQRPDGSIVHDADLTAGQHDLLAIEVDRLQHLVGDNRFTPRFPAPNQRRLLEE